MKKTMILIAVQTALCLLAGCASPAPSQPYYKFQGDISGLNDLNKLNVEKWNEYSNEFLKAPKKTPYDGNPKLKGIYLNRYRLAIKTKMAFMQETIKNGDCIFWQHKLNPPFDTPEKKAEKDAVFKAINQIQALEDRIWIDIEKYVADQKKKLTHTCKPKLKLYKISKTVSFKDLLSRPTEEQDAMFEVSCANHFIQLKLALKMADELKPDLLLPATDDTAKALKQIFISKVFSFFEI